VSSSSPGELGIPRSRDSATNWAADTDPVGPVTPEPAFVDPATTQTQLQREVDMSTAEFGDPNLVQAPVAAPATDGLISPLTISAAAPVESLAQPAPLRAPQPVAPSAPVEDSAPAVPVSDMRDVPLGTLIFRAGLLTEEQLEEALQDGMKRGKRLGEVLLERGLVSEGNLGRLLAGQKGLQFVELDAAAVDPAAVQLIPVEKARLHSVLPIGFHEGLPVVAVVDPSNDLVIENVRRALNCEPHLVVAGREALHRQIEVAYGTVLTAAPVVAQEVPTAPVEAVVPRPEPVVQVTPTAPPEAVAVEPLPVAPAEPVSGEGVWLGTPVTLQPEPIAFQAPEPQPLVVEPMAPVETVAPAPVIETPIVQEPIPEPVSISFTPVAPVEQAVDALAPLPVAEPLVAPEPVVAPQPVVVTEPVVAHETFVVSEPVAQPEPIVAAPAPLLEQPTSEQDEDTVVTWSVVLRLADGDRVEIGAFHSSGEAKDLAQNVVRQISSDHSWPFFGGRFIRPDAIISVDLAEPEGRWLGSVARRQAWTSSEQPS
jgi:type II secretion system (T2SS) protein E